MQQAQADRTNEENVIPALLNRTVQGPATYATFYSATNPAGHKRITVRTTVRPVNMAIQSLFWN